MTSESVRGVLTEEGKGKLVKVNVNGVEGEKKIYFKLINMRNDRRGFVLACPREIVAFACEKTILNYLSAPDKKENKLTSVTNSQKTLFLFLEDFGALNNFHGSFVSFPSILLNKILIIHLSLLQFNHVIFIFLHFFFPFNTLKHKNDKNSLLT